MMRTQLNILFTAATLSVAIACSAYAATKVGVVGASNPDVFAKGTDGNKRTLKVGDEIFLDEEITTSGKGSAQLMFLDKSALTISPNSKVIIDKFVYDPATKDGTMNINGAKGAFRFIGGALTKKKPVTIKTPVSTIGIRGGIGDVFASTGEGLFHFGEQMSLTDNNGNTTTTNEFGSGLGVSDDGGPPRRLPTSVVRQRINNSPANAAADVAPPATPGSDIDKKMDGVKINTSSDDSGGDDQNSVGKKLQKALSGGGDDSGSGNGDGNGGENSDGSGMLNKLEDTANDKVGDGDDSAFNTASKEATGEVTNIKEAAEGPSGADGNKDSKTDEDTSLASQEGAGDETGTRNIRNLQTTEVDTNGDGTVDMVFLNTGDDSGVDGFIIDTDGDGNFDKAGGGDSDGDGKVDYTFNDTDGDGVLDTMVFASDDGGENVNLNVGNLSVDNVKQPSGEGTGGNGQQGETFLDQVQDVAGDILDKNIDTGDLAGDDGSINIADVTGDGNGGPGSDGPGGDGPGGPGSDGPGGPGGDDADDGTGGGGPPPSGGGGGGSSSWVPNPLPADDFVGTFETYEDDTVVTGDEESTSGLIVADETGDRGDYDLAAGSFLAITDTHVVNDVTTGLPVIEETAFALSRNVGFNTLAPSSVVSNDDDNGYEDAWTGNSYIHDANGTFNYYRLEKIDGTEIYQVNFVLGTPFLVGDDDRVDDLNFLTAAQLQARLDEAAQDASGSLVNEGIVEYDFGPDLFSFGATPDGSINYNAWEITGVTSAFELGDPDNKGLLVDWDSRKYFFGFVDFLGDSDYRGNIATTDDGWMMLAGFGDIIDDPTNGSFTAAPGGGRIKNGTLFEGSLIEVYSNDSGNDGVKVADDDLYGQGGDTFVNAGLVFGTDDGLSPPSGTQDDIVGFVFEAEFAEDDVVTRVPVIQSENTPTFTTVTGTAYHGFTGGLMHDKNGNSARFQSGIDGSDLPEFQIGINGSSKTMGGNFTLHGIDTGVSSELDAVIPAGGQDYDFGEGNGDTNAVIQNTIYGSQISNNVAGGTLEGAIIAATDISDESGGNLMCGSCSFVHWGVWAATHEVPGDENAQTNLVPYVAGELTAYNAGTWNTAGHFVFDNGLTTVTYNGDILANKIDTSNGDLFNAHGTFSAQIDLANRKLQAFDGDIAGISFGFNATDTAFGDAGVGDYNAGSPPSSAGASNGGYFFNSAENTFEAPVGCVGGGCTAFTDVSGSVQGALFGNEAQEVGGNYHVQENIGGGSHGAGVFGGAR